MISLPFAETGLTTCGMGNDLQAYKTTTCGSNSYFNGEEVVYIFEAPTTDLYHFALTNSTETWVSLKLYNGCPLLDQGGACVRNNASFGGNVILQADLTEGQTYYLVVSTSGSTCFNFDLSINVPRACPEPGSAGWPVISIPFVETGLTTCSMGNDLQSFTVATCGSGTYFNGEEIVYIFEAPTTDLYHFTLTNSTETWVSLKLYDGCPLLNQGGACIRNNASFVGNVILQADLTEGQTYYLVVSTSGSTCFNFDLSINVPRACPEPGSVGWPVISLPFVETGLTTCGMGNHLQSFSVNSCGSGTYYTGEEVVYIFEAPTTDLYHFTLTNSTQTWVSLKLYDGCPLLNQGGSCVRNAATYSGGVILEAEVEEGQTYYLVVSTSSQNCFQFDLSIFLPQDCPEHGEPGWETIALPFAGQNLTTCGMGNDLQGFNTINCGSGGYLTGEEMVYIFEAPTTDTWYFSLFNVSTALSSLKLYNGCPLIGQPTQCIAQSSGSASDRILQADLQEGQTYYLVVSSLYSPCFTFSLFINLFPELQCPDDMEICPGPNPVVLNMVQPAGGVYSGDGVSYHEESDLYVFNTLGFEGESVVITYQFGGMAESTCSFTIHVREIFAPQEPVALLPEDGATISQPVSFSWEESENALSYDLYIWRSNQQRPTQPTARNITETSYDHLSYLNSLWKYNWQVVAMNTCYSIPGTISSFSLTPLPDLIVSEVLVPETGIAGSEIEIAFTIENNGEGEPGWLPWKDHVYISLLPEFDPDEAILVGAIENSAFPAPGESYTTQTQVELGKALEGEYYIYVVTNGSGNIAEANTDNNKLRSANPVEVNMPPYPDLAVAGVSSMSGDIVPGEMATIGWTVENVGDADAIGGWSQRVSLVSGSNRRVLGFVQYSGTLEPSAIAAQSSTFRIPRTPGMEGKALLEVRLTPNPELVERPNAEQNNTNLSEDSVLVEKKLFLSLSKAELVKNDTIPLKATVSRSGSTQENLDISIMVSQDERLTLPQSVTIPAGQAAVSFTVSPLDNGVVEGAIQLSLTAEGEGYPMAEAGVRLLDGKLPSLLVQLETSEVVTGDTIIVTVNRGLVNDQPLNVNIATNAPANVLVPSSIIIEAGESSAIFQVITQTVNTPEPPRTINLTTSANGFIAGTSTFTIFSSVLPEFGLEVFPGVVSASSVGPVIWGKATRALSTTKGLTLVLSAQPRGYIDLPEAVTIPSFATETEFSIEVKELGVQPEDVDIVITASLFLESCNCVVSSGPGSTVSQTITLTGNSGPTLLVSANPQLAQGNNPNAGTIEITVSEPVEQDTQIDLTVSHPDLLSVPANAIISQGQTSTEVPFQTLSGIIDGLSQTVSVYASADGFNPGSNWIILTNRNLPDLIVSSVQLSDDLLLIGQDLDVEIEITNQGFGTAVSGTDVMIYFSRKPVFDREAIMQAFVFTQETIPAGQSLVVKETVSTKGLSGKYYLMVEINTQKLINEIITSNNRSQPHPFAVRGDFYAMAAVDGNEFSPGSKVPIYGYARTWDELPAANRNVDVYIIVNGARRVIRTTTDGSGNFAVEFQPVPGEGGNYKVGACYPGEGLEEAQAEFVIPAMRYLGRDVVWNLTVDEPYSGTLQVRNLSSVALSGIELEMVSGPAGLDVVIEATGNIPGNTTQPIQYTIKAKGISQRREFEEMRLRLTTAEGVTHHINGWIYSKSPEGFITHQPELFETVALRGQGSLREIQIQNIGEGETGRVTFSLPDIAWISLISPDTIENILPGATATFTLRMRPDAGVPLNVPVTGSFAVNSENANSFSIPFIIEPVSSGTGSLLVDVVNEFTYNTVEAPHLEGATVTLRHVYTGEVITSGISNSSGIVTFENLAEGNYRLVVSKEMHGTIERRIFVEAGRQNAELAFLSYQPVSYSWNVVPSLITDEYEITLVTQFTTHVPMPVVVLDVPKRIPQLGPGESFPLVVTVTNHGLITARNLRLNFAEGSNYTFIHSFDQIDLPAQQTIQIPVLLELNPDKFEPEPGQIVRFQTACGFMLYTPYEYDCGNFTVTKYEREWVSTGGPSCGPPNVGGGPFDTGYGDQKIEGKATPYESIDEECLVDCRGSRAEFLFSCGVCNIPPSSIFCGAWDAFGCVSGSYDECVNGTWMECIRGRASCGSHKVFKVLSIYNCVEQFILDECLLGVDFNEMIDAMQPKSLAHKMEDVKSLVQNDPKKSSAMDAAMIIFELQEISDEWLMEIYGDDTWNEAPEAELNHFWDYLNSYDANKQIELTEELVIRTPSTISNEVLLAFVERWNNTVDMADGLTIESENYIDYLKIDSLFNRSLEIDTLLFSMGYSSAHDMITSIMFDYVAFLESKDNTPVKDEGPESVCATVSMVFSQSLTMTREAFDGTLTLFNGNADEAMENINLTFEIRDGNGINSNHLFDISVLTLESITGISGGGILGAGETGMATIRFIPTREAAPTQPVEYSFGGVLSYLDPFTDQMVNKVLYPVPIMVNPSPDLYIDYFMQRDIIANDPLTDITEPSIPAELAVMIANRGAGDARDVAIASAQPQIIDNEKGLLIDFEIVGSNLSGQPVQLGLLDIGFGNLGPGEITVGQWWFTSSLLGHFISYDVSVVHLNSNGNPRLSLVSEVNIHELIRSVRVYGADDDGIDDFLVNNLPDEEDIPDMLYYSDGRVKPVSHTETYELQGQLDINNLTIELTVEPDQEGWNYIRLNDPGDGNYRIASVVRDDGQEIPLKNIWLTFVRLPDGGEPIYENQMHLLDLFEEDVPQSYTIIFELLEQSKPEVVEIKGIPENISTTPVQTIEVVFSKAINPLSFTWEDISLYRQNGEDISDSLITIQQFNQKTFVVDLSSKTEEDGIYNLTINATEISDLFGNQGAGGKHVTWMQSGESPAILRFFGFAPSGDVPQDSIMVYFNMPVVKSTFTSQKLVLRTQAGDIIPSSDLRIIRADALERLFTISGLAALADDIGLYELTVLVTEITGESGKTGLIDQSVSWSIEEEFILIVQAGSDGSVCASEPFFINNTFTNAVRYDWSGGDGRFQFENEGYYYIPGIADIETGGVNICLTARNDSGEALLSDCLTLTVNKTPATPEVTISGEFTFVSNRAEGNQWYNQNGIIEGATGQEYTPSENGEYYVVVTLEGCSSQPSNPISITLTNTEPLEYLSGVRVYPNPFSDVLNLTHEGNSRLIRFEIINTSGQTVYSGSFTDQATIHTDFLTTGFYLVKLDNGRQFIFRKVLKD